MLGCLPVRSVSAYGAAHPLRWETEHVAEPAPGRGSASTPNRRAERMNGMQVKGILFDNDGTLVDTHDLILASFRYATRTVLHREIPDDDLMRKVGQPLAVQMWDFTDDPETQQELLSVYREHNHALHDQVVRAFDGVVEGLARLQADGFALGVVTGKRHRLAWRGLEVTGAAPYLQCCIGADDCPQYKPDPGPVVAGAKALGLDPRECAYVGDSPYDIEAGNAAGCCTVAAMWGMFSRESLLAEGPAYCCDTFAELVDFLERQQQGNQHGHGKR